MDTSEYDKQSLSKSFAFLRTSLQAKEKELLELQKADPYLLPPDSDQITTLANAINSLQLSTEEGSFVFASTSIDDETSSCTCFSSTDLDSIRSLPASTWLSEENPVKQESEQQSFIFNHLLSLPIKNYLVSESSLVYVQAKPRNQLLCRIPMANHLLFMPIDTFKPPLKNSSTNSVQATTDTQNNHLSATVKSKSIIHEDIIFCKENWLQHKKNILSTNNVSC